MRLRQTSASDADLAQQLAQLEQNYDAQFRVVADAIRELMAPSKTERPRIGFEVRERRAPNGRCAAPSDEGRVSSLRRNVHSWVPEAFFSSVVRRVGSLQPGFSHSKEGIP